MLHPNAKVADVAAKKAVSAAAAAAANAASALHASEFNISYVNIWLMDDLFYL